LSETLLQRLSSQVEHGNIETCRCFP